jgi:hypothetical protein
LNNDASIARCGRCAKRALAFGTANRHLARAHLM